MEGWEKLMEENNKRVEQERKDRKTLGVGDWVIYGSWGFLSGFGMIGYISGDKSTCGIKRSEKQKSFHDSYWEVNPHVIKMRSLREAAERYYYYQCHCTDNRLSSPYHRSDFETRLKQDWPSYYQPLKEERDGLPD